MVRFFKRESGDLFKNRFFGFIFKNRKFVFGLQVVIALLFFYAIYMGFYDSSKDNIFTTALFWGIFWPFFIVTTLPTLGRVFCGICPHGFLGKYITKIGLKRKMPKWLQNRYIGVMLLFIGWWGVYYVFPGVYRTPLGTAILFAVMTIVAFIIYYLYKDMAYCKYICPIGTALRAYAKLSFTFFGSYQSACADCKTFDCAKSCPYALSPFNFEKKKSMGDCTLCMECTHSCEAIRFRLTAPGAAIYEKFKIVKEEVWVYILILAAIPISMAFHHGLGRSNISEEMIWVKTAAWAATLFDAGNFNLTGLFVFLYATLFSVAAAVVGMAIAAKIMKKDFSTTFYTLGYAFAPLFILASFAHAWEYFFTTNSAKIVEGMAWGFGFDIDVDPIAKRGDNWLQVFHLFRWIAVAWAFYILYRRFKHIDASRMRKIFAYPFASMLILFFIGVNIYRDYVLETYGRKTHHTHAPQKHQVAAISTIKEEDAKHIWLSDRVPLHEQGGPGGMGQRGQNTRVPQKSIYLLGGDFSKPLCVNEIKGRFFVVDTQNRYKEVKPVKKHGCLSVRFDTPAVGYYKVYYIQESAVGTKIAKFEFKRYDHNSEEEYSKEKMRAKTIKEVPFDLLRVRPDNETFYSMPATGDTVRFLVLKSGVPSPGVTVRLTTQFGWNKSVKSDRDGVASFKLIKDYMPEWSHFNRRFRETYWVEAQAENGGKIDYIVAQERFGRSRDEYSSSAYALIVAIFLLIATAGGVALYRYRTNRPFKEVKFDE
ncbi:MAG: 4Fe-4S binding protein [Hydrogenimonas sp.]|nr:4Fe-4S binding protein [Hydrogenimonas sp.]